MKFKQILNTKLEFKPLSKTYFRAEHEGHKIDLMTGDHPPDNLYYIYFNHQQLDASEHLPPGWSIREE